jgi:Carboxypeptidase regulatory-like domain
MQLRSMKLVVVLLLAVCVGSTLPAWAQSTSSGTVVGAITDQTGALVAGVTVTLTDVLTNSSRTTVSSSTGRYTFVDVDPGNYTVSVTKAGFATTKADRQEVKVGSVLTINLALQVGGANVVVEVQAAGTDLQTINATVGNNLTGVALDSLPSLNRDVSTFVELQPGVSPDGSVAGAVVDQSYFSLDGGNNTNDMDGSMSVYTTTFAGDPTGGISNQSFAVAGGPTGVMPTPADSVEEFKVNTAGQTADFNSSAGAEVQVVTRRGGNTWHGSAYEYYLDNNFSGNLWDNSFSNTPVPDWHRSRFGARAGGPILPKMLGGKTYFFANYEGYRWPNSETFERITPSANMRLGLLTFGGITYNLNPYQVTGSDGTVYGPNANCTPANGFASGVCDPRGIGINPLVQQMWQTFMPLPNEVNGNCGQTRCDMVDGVGNIGGFKANLALPQTSNFGVARIDHDFGDKWHLTSSYRYFNLKIATDDQVDVGGFFPGDTLGVPASQSLAPQQPWYFVAGLTTNITSNTTNNFHYSYLRNWWQWGRAGDTVQFDGLGGALEPLGESKLQNLSPYNVNTQQTRTRFWDGHDQMFRDDVSTLHGNHLFQFGGTYQHNFNWHSRTDNGGGINYQPVYQLSTTAGAGIGMGGFVPAVGSAASWGRDYASTLGIVSVAQQAYTRSGSDLTLNPPLTPASDRVTIPYYNVYFSDTWHIKPTITLTYGLGWTLEMPPVEANGAQIELVDEANHVIDGQAYLKSRERAALQGQVYNPIVGFNLVGNTENGRKYPYNPFYGSFSPRVALAWNPHFDSESFAGKVFGHDNTVIRGGYGRVYGRLNGVDLVLVPLLGTGLIQPVQCFGPLTDGTTCATSAGANPNNAFRIGVDGNNVTLPAAAPTLPQPLYPGVNGIAAGAGEALDPNFRPNVVDSFNFTIQRQLRRGVTIEAGYIGRRITHEYQPLNLNAVPYMMTLGGQRFDNAYANVMTQLCGGVANLAGVLCQNNPANVTPQPFFEAALGGPTSAYCTGFSSCTAAVVANEGSGGNQNLITGDGLPAANVWSLWSDLDNGAFVFPRSMMNTPIPGSINGGNGNLTSGVGLNASVGHGNYNGAFFSLKMADWHGLTTQSNFTWSKTLSTGAVVQATSADTAPDPYDLNRAYGLAGFDRKFVYNLFFVYQPRYYTGQQGIAGHILGGWTFSPIFTAGTGIPVTLGTVNGGGQAFGEGDSVNFFGNGNSENAIPVGHISTGVHRIAGDLPNLFNSDGGGDAAYNLFRQPILGLDNKDGGWGVIRGLPYWSLDMSIRKNFKVTERFNFEFQTVIVNVLNHPVFFDPGPGDYLDTSGGPDGFGTLPGQGNTPRTMEFGLRFNF